MAEKKGRNMYKVNKNFLILGCLALVSSGTVSAYKVEMENKTGEQLSGTIHVGARGICEPQDFILNPRKGFMKIGTGACCIKKITFEGTKTKIKGEYIPKKTGFGVGCKNQKFEIQKVGSKLIGIHR